MLHRASKDPEQRTFYRARLWVNHKYDHPHLQPRDMQLKPGELSVLQIWQRPFYENQEKRQLFQVWNRVMLYQKFADLNIDRTIWLHN